MGCKAIPHRIGKFMSTAADAKIHYSVSCDLFKSEYELVLEFARDITGLGYVQAGARLQGSKRRPGKMHTWPVPILLQSPMPADFRAIAKQLGQTPGQLMGFIKGKAKDAHFQF